MLYTAHQHMITNGVSLIFFNNDLLLMSNY